jgi:predicted DCC family thiol-disulfide oxidoreductase YuxK
VLYDGACPFCRKQVARLLRLAGGEHLEALDLHDPSVATRYPLLDREDLLEAMHLVRPDGKVYSGFEAAVRALGGRPILGRLALLYYLPGIRQLCDRHYRRLAQQRYCIGQEECEPPPPREP